MHGLVRARARIEARIQAAIAIEPCDPVADHTIVRGEGSSDHHLAIRLQGDRVDIAIGPSARCESRIQHTRAREPGDPATGCSIERGECSRDDDGPVALHNDAGNPADRSGPGVESRIDTGVTVHPDHTAHRHAFVGGEVPPGQDLPVRLHGDGHHVVVRSGDTRIESVV